MSAADFAIVELVSCAPGPAERPIAPVAEITFRVDAWLPHQLATLRKMFFGDESFAAIGAALSRSEAAVGSKVYELGLRRNSARPWTEDEDALLIRDYAHQTASELAARLGRSSSAVYAHARLLELTEGAAPRYSEWEDAQIRAGYRDGTPIATIAAITGRPGSGITSRAHDLGLRHANHAPDWTDAQIARALALAETGMIYRRIGAQLGAEGMTPRSKVGVERILHALGYRRGWGRPWLGEEDALLRQFYERGQSLTPLIYRLARSRHSIRWRSQALGLQGTHPNPNGFRSEPDWTEDQLALLAAEYGKTPTPVLAAKLGRKKAAVYCKANLLGLVHGYLRPFTDDEERAIRIAYDRGISLTDLAAALARDIAVVSKHAKRHMDLHFSARPTKAPRGPRGNRAPVTLASLLALAAAEVDRREEDGQGRRSEEATTGVRAAQGVGLRG